MRKLRDYPDIAAFERQAVMNPGLAAISNGWDDQRVERISKTLFGITDIVIPEFDDEADDTARDLVIAEWQRIDREYGVTVAPDAEQVTFFAQLGWDVTDEYGRPLLVLQHFNRQLLAAIKGEFGATLPASPSANSEVWGASLAADAKRFRSASRHRSA